MVWSTAELKPSFTPDAERYDDAALAKMAAITPEDLKGAGRMRGPNSDSAQRAERQRRAAQQRRIDQFLLGEKPALILTMTTARAVLLVTCATRERPSFSKKTMMAMLSCTSSPPRQKKSNFAKSKWTLVPWPQLAVTAN